MKFSIAISSYPSYSYHYCNATGANKIDTLLDSINRFSSWKGEIVICADHSPAKPKGPSYKNIVQFWQDKFPVIKLIELDEWGNMQNTYRKAVDACTGDVVIFLSDDVIITPGTLEYIIHFWENNDLEKLKCGLQKLSWIDVWFVPGFEREDFYMKHYNEWYKDILNNYQKELDLSCGRVDAPYIYSYAFGAGFAFKKELWKEIGGTDRDMHMFDEDLSFRTITKTDKLVYGLPNPPLIHFAAGSQAGSDDNSIIHAHEDAYEIALKSWGIPYVESAQYLANIVKERKESLPKGLVKNSLLVKGVLGWYVNKKQLNLLN